MREVSELRDELRARSAETAEPSGTAPSANGNAFFRAGGSNADLDFSTGDATPAEVGANQSHNLASFAWSITHSLQASYHLQAAVIGTARDFLDRLLQFLKALLRVFTIRPSDLAGDVERWESILFHAKTLANPTNDLGAGKSSGCSKSLNR